MDYEQIKTFLAIVDTNSVSRAANLLFTSQSTVSKRIKSLETELGTRLISREKGQRHIRMTLDGERFYSLAKEYQDVNFRLEQFKDNKSRNFLRIASIDSLNVSILRKLYPKLLNQMPNLELTVTTNQTGYIYDKVNLQDFDMGFVLSEYRWPNVIVKPFIVQRFKLLVCSERNMEHIAPPSPADLDPSKEVFQPWGPSFQQWHEYWWPKNGYRVKVDTLSMVDENFFHEGYWSIVPDSISEMYQHNPRFHILDLAEAPPERQCYLIKNKYPQNNCIRAMEKFQEILDEFQHGQE